MKATEVPEITGAYLFEPTPYADEKRRQSTSASRTSASRPTNHAWYFGIHTAGAASRIDACNMTGSASTASSKGSTSISTPQPYVCRRAFDQSYLLIVRTLRNSINAIRPPTTR